MEHSNSNIHKLVPQGLSCYIYGNHFPKKPTILRFHVFLHFYAIFSGLNSQETLNYCSKLVWVPMVLAVGIKFIISCELGSLQEKL